MRSATGAMEGMSAYVARAAAASSEVLQVKGCTKHNSTIKYDSVSPHTNGVQLNEELL